MIIHKTDNLIISFKKNTAMFREINTNKILGVVVYNPEYCRWRYISSEEYHKFKEQMMNIYDI